jgi:hemolysin activation/secretion protein
MPDAGTISRENERRQEQLDRRNAPAARPPVLAPDRVPMTLGPGGGPTFLLRQVIFDKSEFLSEDELQSIAKNYTGKSVDNLQIQKLVKEVNDLFADRRIATGIAYLPQQNVRSGILRVAIIEGKLGKVIFTGNEHVKEEDLRPFIKAEPGKVLDLPALERDVAWFNRSRTVQMQAALQPGASFGLTDIQLTVQEPPTNSFSGYIDNMGVDSVGKYQGGGSYQRSRLAFDDDRLTLFGVLSQGNRSLNAAYNLPFNPWGGRIGVSASRGNIHIVSGPYSRLKVDGESMSIAVNASQPIWMNSTWVVLANAAVSMIHSTSTEKSVPITDNTSMKKTLGATVTYTSQNWSATLAPNVSQVESRMDVTGVTQSFMAFNMVTNAMLRLPMDFTLVTNTALQWATRKLLTSDQLFQIGGPTTVRGYPSNGAAGYAGWYTNIELRHSLEEWIMKGVEGFAFVDQGSVLSTFPERVDMLSFGAGATWDTGYRGVTVDLTVAIPVMRAMPAQSGAAIYGRVSAKF